MASQSYEWALGYFAGMIDSDGCVEKSARRVRFINTDPGMLIFMMEIAHQIGLVGTRGYQQKFSDPNHKDVVHLTWTVVKNLDVFRRVELHNTAKRALLHRHIESAARSPSGNKHGPRWIPAEDELLASLYPDNTIALEQIERKMNDVFQNDRTMSAIVGRAHTISIKRPRRKAVAAK